jgi:ribosomal protein S7
MKNKITYTLYLKMLGFFIRNGKKSLAKNIIFKIFFYLNFFYKKPFHYFLNKIYILLNTFVETKTLKIKRKRFVVPFPIDLKRRIHLITKWLFFVSKNNKRKIPFYHKFLFEVILLFFDKNTKVINLWFLNYSKSLVNRSNLHFRW